MRELEILAPAGNLEIFKGVLEAGADAVYFGGTSYGARATAGNLTIEESREAVEYAHLFGKKAYLTVNTLLKNKELGQDFYNFIKSYYEMGLDAFLVQDMGVFSFITEYFPDACIHMSTQAAVASSYGVDYWTKKGAARIVLPRELSLKEIRSIYEKTGAELEAFVHGALCVCYSGDCLMSSMIGGRSGNRGRCAQPCRLPYSVGGEQKYLLSPKDICNIKYFKEMYEAGVTSFKIEGRLRSLEYATGVVAVYRKYADRILSGQDAAVSGSDMKDLKRLGSRSGFTSAYLTKRNDPEMITYSSPSFTSENISIDRDTSKVELDGSFTAVCGSPVTLEARVGQHSVTLSGNVCEKATGKGTTEADIRKQLSKTGASSFSWKGLDIKCDEGIFIPLGSLNELRRQCFAQLTEALTGVDREEAKEYSKDREYNISLLKPFDKADDKPVVFALAPSTEMASGLLAENSVTHVGLYFSIPYEEDVHPLLEEIISCGKRPVLMLPPVIREDMSSKLTDVFKPYFNMECDFLTDSYDGIGFLLEMKVAPGRIIPGPRFYSMNNRAVAFLRNEGLSLEILPFELSEGELSHRDNESSLMYVYGRVPLMYMANCTHKNLKGCDKVKETLYIKDRYKADFPVVNDCSVCMNTVFNSVPTSLISDLHDIDRLGVAGYFIDLTCENKKTAREIMEAFSESVESGTASELPFAVTRGHFKRGVK